ncbi:hypothetical protein N8878_07665 [Psychromonas sp.]|nr:hypothetical protein [Psychromonas sp.]
MKSILFNSAFIAIPALSLSANVFAAEEVKETSIDLSNITAYRAANTPVNYSYISLSAGKNDYENYNQAATTLGVRGQALLNERFIFKMGYETTLLDKDNSGNDLSYQSSGFDMGFGLRQAISKSTDIELDARIIYNWSDNDSTGESVDDLGYRVGAYFNQGIGDSFEGTLGVTYTSEYSQESVNFMLSITQYVTEYVGVGLNGRFGSGADDGFSGDQAYVGAHVRLAFY